MAALDKAKILAEIGKLGAEIYGLLVDKDLAKKNDDKDRRIKTLETEVAELKKKLEALEHKP